MSVARQLEVNVVLGMSTALIITKTEVCVRARVSKIILCLEHKSATVPPLVRKYPRSSSGRRGVGLAEAD